MLVVVGNAIKIGVGRPSGQPGAIAFPAVILPTSALLSGYLVVTALLVLTPGVGTTFLLSTVLTRGRTAAYRTATGMVTGAAIHATIAAFGAAALIRVAPRATEWIALIGGALVVFLGLRALIVAARAPSLEASVTDGSAHGQAATGLLISLSNAPLPLFYLVVVPQYVPHGMSRLAGVALLSAIHLAMAFSWMLVLITIVGRAVDLLRRPVPLLMLRCTTGLLLIVLGLRAILKAV